MRALGFWTWSAIVLLVAGPVAIFAWFLRDALALLKSLGERDDAEHDGQETGPIR